MAIPSWPSELPQALLVDGYSQAAADNVLRTPMDQGPDKVRRKQTSGPRPVSGSIIVTTAQLATYKTFYVTTLLGGSLRFSHVDPDDGTTAVEMRHTAPPSWSPAGLRWRVALALEILP